MNKDESDPHDIEIEKLRKKTQQVIGSLDGEITPDNIDQKMKELAKLKKKVHNLIAEIEVEHFLEFGSQMKKCPELV